MSVVKKKRRRRADGLATRERILEVATHMFAAAGYEATSLRQIAAASSIDIATLKYHYQDKASLFAEVYSQGHVEFLQALAPVMLGLDSAQDADQVRRMIHLLVTSMHDFVDSNLPFVKLTLFRLMEENTDIVVLEDELQVVALETLEGIFAKLASQGIIQPVDARGVVVFLISSFSMWNVTARVKPSWMAEPHIQTPEGRARSERFFITTVERMLGVELPQSSPAA